MAFNLSLTGMSVEDLIALGETLKKVLQDTQDKIDLVSSELEHRLSGEPELVIYNLVKEQ